MQARPASLAARSSPTRRARRFAERHRASRSADHPRAVSAPGCPQPERCGPPDLAKPPVAPARRCTEPGEALADQGARSERIGIRERRATPSGEMHRPANAGAAGVAGGQVESSQVGHLSPARSARSAEACR